MAKKKDNGNGNGGTALVTIDPVNYPALDPTSDLREAMLSNMEGEQLTEGDLIRVTTPAGGATNWVIPTIAGEKIADELTGVLVYFCKRGVLWPTEDASTGTLPLLISRDLITATRVGDDYGDIDPDELEKYRVSPSEPATYDWFALPWNQWGTGKKGSGKRCKESRLLFLLREGEPFPVLVRAQPGSLKTIRPFLIRLPVPMGRAVVTLRLRAAESKRGERYAQIVPEFVGALDKSTGEQVQKLYTEPLRRMVSGVIDSDRDVINEA